MNLNVIGGVALTLVVAGILIAFGLQILGDLRDSDSDVGVTASCGLNSSGGSSGTIAYTACGADYNATVDAVEAVGKLGTKIPLIATIVIAVIVIGLLVGIGGRKGGMW